MVMGKGRIVIHLRAPSFLLPQTVKDGIFSLEQNRWEIPTGHG